MVFIDCINYIQLHTTMTLKVKFLLMGENNHILEYYSNTNHCSLYTTFLYTFNIQINLYDN